MKNKKTIYTEPWIGEFGWELFCWQGFLRRLEEKTEDRFIITCRDGHEFLYQDFAYSINTYNPSSEETDMYKNHGIKLASPFDYPNTVCNNSYPEMWWRDEHFNVRQSFIKYGKVNPDLPSYDVLLHLRNTEKCRTGFRNWPGDHALRLAEQLVASGLKVACIGTSDASLSIYGIPHHLDVPLVDLADLMNNAKVLIGPQSGPTHFATLCGLPQITWQTKQEHADRVSHKWNPFRVPVATIPSPDVYWKQRKLWTPDYRYILKLTYNFLNRNEVR